jgi:hypothetical protein
MSVAGCNTPFYVTESVVVYLPPQAVTLNFSFDLSTTGIGGFTIPPAQIPSVCVSVPVPGVQYSQKKVCATIPQVCVPQVCAPQFCAPRICNPFNTSSCTGGTCSGGTCTGGTCTGGTQYCTTESVPYPTTHMENECVPAFTIPFSLANINLPTSFYVSGSAAFNCLFTVSDNLTITATGINDTVFASMTVTSVDLNYSVTFNGITLPYNIVITDQYISATYSVGGSYTFGGVPTFAAAVKVSSPYLDTTVDYPTIYIGEWNVTVSVAASPSLLFCVDGPFLLIQFSINFAASNTVSGSTLISDSITATISIPLGEEE